MTGALRRVRLFALPVLAVVAVLSRAAPVGAAPGDLADWDQPVVRSTFQDIEFEQGVTVSFDADRAELIIELPDRIPLLVEVDPPRSHVPTVLRYKVEPGVLGITPHTPIAAHWRLTFGAVLEETGPSMETIYEDDRFEWHEASRTVHGLPIRVHWYETSDGQTGPALDAASAGLSRAEEAFGVQQTRPVDVFLYADQTAFQEATGVTRDFSGAMDSYTGATFVISRGPIDEVTASTIRHEVTHVVFKTAFGIPASAPPRWLNEGAASYLMDLYGGSWFRSPMAQAAHAGTVIPLERLGYSFPSITDAIDAAYNEGASAVEYLVSVHGPHVLADLGAAYRSGMSDDEAFASVLGVDLAGFQAAWLAYLEAEPIKTYGPRLPKPALAAAPVANPASRAGADDGTPKGRFGLALRLLFGAIAALLIEVEVLRIRSGRSSVRQPVGWRSWAPSGPALRAAPPPPVPLTLDPPPFPPSPP